MLFKTTASSADILNIVVDRPLINETTAQGVAYLAGLAVGYWESLAEVEKHRQMDREFEPEMADERRKELYDGWHKAVKAAQVFK